MDIRNDRQIELAKLRRTDDLPKRLPLGPGVLEPKRNGHRYSLQMGGGFGAYLTSRSRAEKTKGVDVAASKPFKTIEPEPWLVEVSDRLDDLVLLDGEREPLNHSSASEASKKDGDKKFVAWDVLQFAECDYRSQQLRERRQEAKSIVHAIAHEHLHWIGGREFDEFTQHDLDAVLATIKAIRDGGGLCEGFVYKEFARDYDRLWYGWKIKLEECEDGFVVARKEEFKHHLGKRTRTGKVGTVGVAMRLPETTKFRLVAWVPLPDEDRCQLTEFDDKLKGRIVEFSHLGWNGNLFDFVKFVRWRDEDKDSSQCIMDQKYLAASFEAE